MMLIFIRLPREVRLHDQRFPSVTMGVGALPESGDRIRVFTISITATQQEHRIGARSLTQAIDRTGLSFMSND